MINFKQLNGISLIYMYILLIAKVKTEKPNLLLLWKLFLV